MSRPTRWLRWRVVSESNSAASIGDLPGDSGAIWVGVSPVIPSAATISPVSNSAHQRAGGQNVDLRHKLVKRPGLAAHALATLSGQLALGVLHPFAVFGDPMTNDKEDS